MGFPNTWKKIKQNYIEVPAFHIEIGRLKIPHNSVLKKSEKIEFSLQKIDFFLWNKIWFCWNPFHVFRESIKFKVKITQNRSVKLVRLFSSIELNLMKKINYLVILCRSWVSRRIFRCSCRPVTTKFAKMSPKISKNPIFPFYSL